MCWALPHHSGSRGHGLSHVLCSLRRNYEKIQKDAFEEALRRRGNVAGLGCKSWSSLVSGLGLSTADGGG